MTRKLAGLALAGLFSVGSFSFVGCGDTTSTTTEKKTETPSGTKTETTEKTTETTGDTPPP